MPKSPRTPTVSRGMGHMITHRFTKTFKMMTTCDYCDKQMFIGLKCKECKYKCHKDCASKVPPSCGLPQELIDEFKRTLQADSKFKIHFKFEINNLLRETENWFYEKTVRVKFFDIKPYFFFFNF